MVLINHPDSSDPTPDEDDKNLMRALQADAQALSFKPFFTEAAFWRQSLEELLQII